MFTINELSQLIKDTLSNSDNILSDCNAIRKVIHDMIPIKQPVDFVRWVPIEKVKPNDYNPNSVAKIEMGLLYKSIKQDGYTQPIVTIYDDEKDEYVIVDGFHRYFVCLTQKDIQERNKGMLPIVVIDKNISERMAATVRHNRARGAHSISGMSNMVFKMLDQGCTDQYICENLGLDPTELIKLKHLSGFSKLFDDTEYNKAWVTKSQLLAKKQYEESLNNEKSRKTP